MEGKIHRWLSSVNALPGGMPARDVMTNHRPEPKQHPGLVVVGDYLFDSTLNGLLDSSDAATDIVVTEMMRLRRARGEGGKSTNQKPASDKIDRDYFENYRGLGPYSEAWSKFTDPSYLTDLIKIVWNRTRGYKLLVAGSASGELVGALRARGIDAWGIENNRAIHTKTPKALHKFNKLGSIVDMPFKDEANSISCSKPACAMSRRSRWRARSRELNRVVKTGPGVRLDHLGHDSPALDRPLRSAARGQETRYLVGMVGIVLQQWLRSVDAPPRVFRRDMGGDTGRRHGAGANGMPTSESLRYSFFDKVEADDD